MDNDLYYKTLAEVGKTLVETTVPIRRVDTRKMSGKQKSEKIAELEDQIHSLKRELMIRESVNKRYIQGLIESRYNVTNSLLNDPILTLPSGAQIQFSLLNSEQLEYLESLAPKQKNYK